MASRHPETGYVTDRFGDGAIDFIKQNKQKPFFSLCFVYGLPTDHYMPKKKTWQN